MNGFSPNLDAHVNLRTSLILDKLIMYLYKGNQNVNPCNWVSNLLGQIISRSVLINNLVLTKF